MPKILIGDDGDRYVDDLVNARFGAALEAKQLALPIHTITARAWTSGWGELLGGVAPSMAPGGRAIIFAGDQTLRDLRRQLAQGAEPARQNVAEWRAAAVAGWTVKRAKPLPHMDQCYLVTLEMST